MLKRTHLSLAFLSLSVLAGCQHEGPEMRPLSYLPPVDAKEQECLARAMYFESQRSSRDGMLAVGSVVMNRLESERYSDSVCAVVGQKNQFAPGVMTREMAKGRDLALETAGDVLAGARHKDVKRETMFFHTAGLSFPYPNMSYTTIAGGNAFYEKVSRDHQGPIVSQFSLTAAE